VLFNSYVFIFMYLPIVLAGFFALGKHSHFLSGLWLFAASLFFYGWWDPASVGLLLASMLFNYGIGLTIVKQRHAPALATWMLRLGVAANLGLLGYYKYADFFIKTLDAALGLDAHTLAIALPLGISFFTFTQIAFLVDAYRGKVQETNLVHYGLFITYFPHLIAGPVIHHKEMMPQFARKSTNALSWPHLSAGLTLFAIGLLKKVGLADAIAPYASPAFAMASAGDALTFLEAWAGALAYTFQLYFDFSGYSDMAIGLSCMFGVKLPLNFHSPYKSVNIIEFWRRWHITLSRFLRDYLYISLGGNRKGGFRRYINLMLTMLLGGLWHGAGWTFVIWGGLHGLYLVINHGWHQLRTSLGQDLTQGTPAGRLAGMTLTFLAVVVAWVFFRAADLKAALNMVTAMAGWHGVIYPHNVLPAELVNAMAGWGLSFGDLPLFARTPGDITSALSWIAGLWALVWLAPNSQEIMAAFNPSLETITSSSRVRWQPNKYWLLLTVVALLYAFSRMGKVSEFLYFQF
jgi:alginate O-acetyltransferase complex protein AlgI